MRVGDSEEQLIKAYIDRLNKAQTEISEIVCKLDKENKEELHKELCKDFCTHNSQDEGESKKKEVVPLRCRWVIYFILILIVIFVVSCYVATEVGGDKKIQNDQIFLAFVVALASYLASVSRETVKALSSSVGDARIRYKKNIFMMAIAEMQLILISVLTMCKIAFEPGFILRNFPFLNIDFLKDITLDSFLVSYLLMTIFWLAIIHLRVWWNASPWDVYKLPTT